MIPLRKFNKRSNFQGNFKIYTEHPNKPFQILFILIKIVMENIDSFRDYMSTYFTSAIKISKFQNYQKCLENVN